MPAPLVLQEARIGQPPRELAQTITNGRAIMSVGDHEDRHGQPPMRGEAMLEERREVRGAEFTAVA